MEIIILWLAFSIGIGFFAGSRGRSGFLWFLFSFFLSPLLAFIILLVIPDINKLENARIFAQREREREAEREQRNHTARLEEIKALQTKSGSPNAQASSSIAEELGKLAELRDRGILTDAEFQEQKVILLKKPS